MFVPVDLLTPVVKGWCTDTGVEVASIGVQIHGGYGFDFSVGGHSEQHTESSNPKATGIQGGHKNFNARPLRPGRLGRTEPYRLSPPAPPGSDRET